MKIIVIFLMLGVSACTTMPSDIKYNYSNSTQSKEIYMQPGNIFNDSFVSYSLRLGLYKTSLMKDDSLVMTVQVPGVENIDSLMINCDGQQTDFKSIDTFTSHDYIKGNSQMNGYSESSKRFNVSISFIQKMMKSNQVWVRVGLSKTYIEGDFLKHKDNSSMTAYNGFKKFLNQLYKVDEKYAYLADPKTLPPNIKIAQPSMIVAEPEESKEKRYERLYSPVDRKNFRHQDESVDIILIPKTNANSLPFMFENKSNEVVKIIWDESAFINHKGEAEKIIHEGVLLKDKSLSQMPTVIPPKSNIKDSVSPVSKIVILPSSRDWGYLNICGDDVSWPEIGTTDEEDCVGGIFGFFLTYEIGGKKKNVLIRYKYDKRLEIIEKKEIPVIKVEEKQTPMISSPPTPSTYKPESSGTGFQFGVGLSSWVSSSNKGTLATKYRAGSLNTSGSMSRTLDGDYSGGLTLSANLRNLPDDSIGFTSSFEYLINASGSDMTQNVEFSGYILKANLARKIGSVYLYGGINLPNYQVSIKNSNIPGFNLSYDASSAMGGQGGIGIMASNQFAIEIEYEVLQFNVNLSQRSKTNPNTEYIEQEMESFINNVKIGLKLFF